MQTFMQNVPNIKEQEITVEKAGINVTFSQLCFVTRMVILSAGLMLASNINCQLLRQFTTLVQQ